MSAPRFFPTRLTFRFAATAVAMLVATGCTVPGKSRLEGPPKDLPPALAHVTADVLGFWLLDPARDAERRDALGGGIALVGANPVDAAITQDTSDWIGESEGLAVRELDVDDETDATTLYFADVRDGEALRKELRAESWVEEGIVEGDDSTEFVRHTGDYRALAIYDDAVIAARSERALRTFVRAADDYAVSERKAMREFAVEARKRSPIAFVFRSDLLRTQVRRPFEQDPALLEFARWATDSNVLVALRDGWIGLSPALDEDARDEHVRIVGVSEWVPDLAPDITLGAADPKLLSEVGPDPKLAIAFDDPGQHVAEAVRAITLGSGQYVTEQDVADDGERVDLLPLLDELDGNAALGWGDGILTIVTEGDEQLGARVEEALDHAGVDAEVTAGSRFLDDDLMRVEIATTRGAAERGRYAVRTTRNLDGAGEPPRAPFLWFTTNGLRPLGRSVGWMTFNGTDRITLAADVTVTNPTR